MKTTVFALLCAFSISNVHAARTKITLNFENTETYYKVADNEWQLESGMLKGTIKAKARAGLRTAGGEAQVLAPYEKTDLHKLYVGKDEIKVVSPKEESEELQTQIIPAKVKVKRGHLQIKTKKETDAAMALVKANTNLRTASAKIKIKKARRVCKQESESTLKCKVGIKLVIKASN